MWGEGTRPEAERITVVEYKQKKEVKKMCVVCTPESHSQTTNGPMNAATSDQSAQFCSINMIDALVEMH